MNDKKYELTNETINYNGIILHRIKALKSFNTVKKGDLGGWVEKESNLSQEGNCWIYDEAKVFDNACVYDDAQVYDNAHVYRDARIYGTAWVHDNARVGNDVCIYNANISIDATIYSNKDYITIKGINGGIQIITFYKSACNIIRVVSDLFSGTLDEYKNSIYYIYDNIYKEIYLSIIKAVTMQFKINDVCDSNMKNKKYELTNNFINYNGRVLHRIKALKDFGNVKKGDLGGWVEKEYNLSHEGECWIYDEAKVFDNASIHDSAKVLDKAKVYENAQIYDNVKIGDSAKLYGNIRVYNNVWVYNNAWLFGNVSILSNDDYLYVNKWFGSKSERFTFFKADKDTIGINYQGISYTVNKFIEYINSSVDETLKKDYALLLESVSDYFNIKIFNIEDIKGE